MSRRPCIVAKLGGSLLGDPCLSRWLEALSATGSAHFVVVPGGGPFADAVRSAQAACGVSDEVAHTMALLAMEQFGHLLTGLHPRVVPCSAVGEFESAWKSDRLPVWLPARLVGSDPSLPRSWNVTSDTIAAWLAERIGADALWLVKSCKLPAARQDAVALVAAGIVDPSLPGFALHHGIHLDTLQRNQWTEVESAVGRIACRL